MTLFSRVHRLAVVVGLCAVLLVLALAVGGRSVAGVDEPVPYAWFVAVFYVAVACLPMAPVFPGFERAAVRRGMLTAQRTVVSLVLVFLGLPVLATVLDARPVAVVVTSLMAVGLVLQALLDWPVWSGSGAVGTMWVGLQVVTPWGPIDRVEQSLGVGGSLVLLTAALVLSVMRRQP